MAKIENKIAAETAIEQSLEISDKFVRHVYTEICIYIFLKGNKILLRNFPASRKQKMEKKNFFFSFSKNRATQCNSIQCLSFVVLFDSS